MDSRKKEKAGKLPKIEVETGAGRGDRQRSSRMNTMHGRSEKLRALDSSGRRIHKDFNLCVVNETIMPLRVNIAYEKAAGKMATIESIVMPVIPTDLRFRGVQLIAIESTQGWSRLVEKGPFDRSTTDWVCVIAFTPGKEGSENIDGLLSMVVLPNEDIPSRSSKSPGMQRRPRRHMRSRSYEHSGEMSELLDKAMSDEEKGIPLPKIESSKGSSLAVPDEEDEMKEKASPKRETSRGHSPGRRGGHHKRSASTSKAYF
eukprot:TRINITY_DN1349_c0_g1_i1.p1 TRINITY_DN1349_c0_g1~~TRINITY_DN1349_c0_g1_i1.p1  ORF type:complete len:259 (+),score=58.40 TRINITY_DN1349_c0_g1_i1:63-839(+)